MADIFDCFGEEDDSSENETLLSSSSSSLHHQSLIEDNDSAIANKRMELLAQANQKISATQTRSSSCDGTNKESTNASTFFLHEQDKSLETLPSFIKLPFDAPLYLGPMRVVQPENVGGNRGYIATENLPPGTLLLVEEPIFEWSEEQIGKELGLISIQDILSHKNAWSIVHNMEGLYPTKTEVDAMVRTLSKKINLTQNEKVQVKDMMDIMEMQHSGSKEMKQTLEMATMAGIALDEVDVLRMLLTLRYNGFGSGVYLHFAMFNHDDDANCVKFIPERQHQEDHVHERVYSEVRTTKYVKRGESLTLHYLDPREVSHASRRHHLWDQHRFDIGADMTDGRLKDMELVSGMFPTSVHDRLDKHRITYDVESTLSELEQCYHDITIAWNIVTRTSDVMSDVMSDERIEIFERCKALEMASDEMIRASKDKLGNDQHLLLIRCCRLHVDSVEILMKFSNQLTNKQQVSIMLRFVQTSHFLLPLQVMYLGPDHPDIARTNYDLAMGINGLLSRASDQLFALGDAFSTFFKCQWMESNCRKEHRRIDGLYPKDVHQKIFPNIK
jgi:hypothetical protein